MSADPFHPLAAGDTALFYRAAIGVRGQGYHLPRFLRFDEAGQTGLSWNWAASLFTFNWLVYRKMWNWALAYVGVMATAGLLVFGVGKLVFDYSSALAWMLGLWFLSAAYIVPGLYANVWLYGHYNDKISEVLRKSSGVVDTVGRLTAVAPGPRRFGWQVLANLLVVGAVLAPVAAMQDWQRMGGQAWAKLASAVSRHPSQPDGGTLLPLSPSAPAASGAQSASGRVAGLAPTAPAIAPAPAPTATPQAASAVSARPAPLADDAATRPVVAFEPAFDATTRPGRSGADLVPVTSFAANPLTPAPLNAPLPAPFSGPAAGSGPGSGSSSAPSTGSATASTDLVPLQSVTLPSSRLQSPPPTAPRVRQLAQADTTTAPMGNRSGNVASGVVTRPAATAPASASPAPAVSAPSPARPVAPVMPSTPRRASAAEPTEGEKPQASARLRAASQAAQAKRAAQSQEGGVSASVAPQSAVATASPSVRSAATASTWVVQAGVFRQADNANRVLAQLRTMGIEAGLETVSNNRGESLQRVVAGPYTQQAQAQQTAQRIQARSLPAVVMREAR
ncbi:SPOR domain-containing protein [Hylemonella gracilis]|uniref:Sporulation domain-containing protein n=1 Tax=Hylemonella gracilis ATCC 19624 TaxID=887062 RepID=F3KTQ5_9BURK|nr:SPOR domain-containing protein [Hylemonella gracilis]EGI76934.1 Sporulation domain-containing protein [Hylemonella gracilis ATCC 19624]